MAKPANVLIHQFLKSAPPRYDDEGDIMLGFYFQFTTADDKPIGGLIGPFELNTDAEKAALLAFSTKDY